MLEASPAGIALPIMANFDALDVFRRHGRDHPVVAVWAAHVYGEGANGANNRWVAKRLHNFDLLVFGDA